MDDLVKKAVERSLIRKPSKGFADRVMGQVFQLKASKPYQPIISKKAWIVIGVFFVIGIVALLFVQTKSVEENGTLTFVDKITEYFNSMNISGLNIFSNVNLLLVAGISLAIFLLLFFDSYITRKR